MNKQLGQTLATLEAVLADVSIHEALIAAAKLTADAMKAGRKLMVCGNGGSAADAQHIVAEFVSRLTVDRPAMRAVALTTDTSILTAIANDYCFERVFERQLEALGIAGDVLLAISTSGNSKNCLRALKQAREIGIATIAFTGNGGGAMKEFADLNVIVPSTTTMHIQEAQIALEHIFCMIVERFYFGTGIWSGCRGTNRVRGGLTSHIPRGSSFAIFLIGGWNTIFGYGCFFAMNLWIASRLGPYSYVAAGVVSSLINITVAFLGYKWFVFRTRGNYLREWLRTVAVYSGSILITTLALVPLVELIRHATRYAAQAPYIAAAILAVVTVVGSFFGHRHFSFRESQPEIGESGPSANNP